MEKKAVQIRVGDTVLFKAMNPRASFWSTVAKIDRLANGYGMILTTCSGYEETFRDGHYLRVL
jgi:hypothetical protein